MFLWSGRTKSSIISIFDDISSRPIDVEHISLLQNSQVITSNKNSYRGFEVLKNENFQAVCIDYDIKYFSGIPRKIVFVFGGMGTQWHRMSRINLKGILNSTNKNVCENFHTSCIAIVSIEIALTDIFEALGVKFDFIIGHSVSEIACAYADKCLTREKVLTAAYLRAKLTIDSKIHGRSLAVVGVHYSKLTHLPPVANVLLALISKKNFVNEVPSAGIAFHSRYIKKVGEKHKKALKKLIKSPKIRSSKWITTSYPKNCESNNINNQMES
ncbi:hypothetical protein PVAND_004727 [Polypedilum vanderplanki]|nr:hypothetical protein PVAND_004727 [Polypedilum vanderplanki]